MYAEEYDVSMREVCAYQHREMVSLYTLSAS